MVPSVYLWLVFVPTLFHECSTAGFISHPNNVSVKVGGTANFECIFDGPDVFLWVINGIRHAYGSQLPPKHMVDDSGNILTVTDVDQQLNGNSYKCITTHFESLIAYLLIFTESQYTDGEYSLPSSHSIIIYPTAAVTSINKVTLKTSMQLGIVVTGVRISTTPTISHQFIHGTIIINAIVSTVLTVLCCCGLGIMIIASFIVVRRSHCRKKTHQREPEVVKNEAYEITKIRKQAKIITKPNEAYSMVHLD